MKFVRGKGRLKLTSPPSSGSGGTAEAPPSGDEPMYTGAAGQTLIFDGNSADAEYADLDASGALIGGTGGPNARLFPRPSPLSAYLVGSGGSTIDTSLSGMTTGVGGAGKALQNFYHTTAVQIGPNVSLYVPAAVMDAIPATATVIIQFNERKTGAMQGGTAIKYARVMVRQEPFGSGMPQFSTQNGPAPASSTSGKHTYFQVYVRSYNDGTNPTGNQGMQPFGPYFQDEFDSAFRQVTLAVKKHTNTSTLDGFARHWRAGTKIADVSVATVGVTPPGGEKPWCAADGEQIAATHWHNAVDHPGWGDASMLFHLGGDLSTPLPLTTQFGLDYDIDSFKVWYVV